MATLEIDYMEYSSDALAQAAYVSTTSQKELSKYSLFSDGSLVAYYKLEDVNDSKGSFTLTNNNTVVFNAAKFNNGADFGVSNSNKYLSRTSNVSSATTNFTMACWVYCYNVSQAGIILSNGSGGAGWNLVISNGSGGAGAKLTYLDGGVTWHDTSFSFSATTWTHIAVTNNGTVTKIYANKNEVYSSDPATNSVPASAFAIGANSDGSNLFFSGIVDDVCVFTRALSAAEIATLYDASADILVSSESTIKTQGSYALKAVAAQTDSLNKTLTRTATIGDLTSVNSLKFDIRSSRTGANIKIGLVDVGATTEITPSITTADTFQTVIWDISAVSDANKNAITAIVITIVNADSANTFYIDNFIINTSAGGTPWCGWW